MQTISEQTLRAFLAAGLHVKIVRRTESGIVVRVGGMK